MQLSISQRQDASRSVDITDLDSAAGSWMGLSVEEGGEGCESLLRGRELGGRTRRRRGGSARVEGGGMALCCGEAIGTDVEAQSLHLSVCVVRSDKGGDRLLVSVRGAMIGLMQGGDETIREQWTEIGEDGAAGGRDEEAVEEGSNLIGG
jgi:hypothetical protein